ncbi:alpha/beta hydrolase [Acaryochloris sp. IP29b_bin.148]|uniref:alpha/beta fold hydrolase n=1 Tax=Acaryochloris sp. IP29b_bin.148 TaxID=2969218 RepID=UPI00262C4D31|nr:alpha/beta hydrolase [Acaryochloris sp. IP29b_bin.148]
MPKVQIRGHDHYYEWVTREPRQSGSNKPVMVFLHGWGGSGRYWQPVAQSLSTDFDCLLYDLRGFGQSQDSIRASKAVEAYTLQSYVEDLAALLDALEISQVFLQAHSMGSTIGALFLNQYPQRVQQAILACSGLFEYDEQEFRQFHQVGEWVVRLRPRWLAQVPLLDRLFMARFLHRPIAADQRRGFVSDYVSADAVAALGTLLSAVSESVATAMAEEFARLQISTLIVSGDKDQIVPADSGEEAAALNPNIDYVRMDQTGHFPMLEDTSTYLQHIHRFLTPVLC